MGWRGLGRGVLERAGGLFMRQVVYRPGEDFRKLAYTLRSPHEPLMVAGDRETYIIRGGDKYIGRDLFVTGEFDFAKLEEAVRQLARLGKAPTTIIDVGANIGTICIPAVARRLFERAIAIEAEPVNVKLLKANVALNELDAAIQIIGSAVGATDDGTLRIGLADENYGDHRVVQDGDSNRASVEVPCGTLDVLCANADPAQSLIWMDIQGFEGIALLGARRFIEAKTPLVLEFDPAHIERCGSVSQLVKAVGSYSQFVELAGEGAGALRPISELGALEREIRAGREFTDILLV